MREEPVPVELPSHRVEGPVRLLGVDEDDPRVAVLLAGVAPHVVVAVRPVGVAPRLLEPRVRVGRVVHDEVGDDADAAPVRGVEQVDEIVDGAELGQHLVEVADVVAAVAQRRVVERRQPKTVDAKPLQVVELFGQAAQVTGAVGVGVVERAHQHLVEHRALEPGAVLRQHPGVPEVVGGGMFDHAVLDVAAVCRIDAADLVHQPSNLPMAAEIESRPPDRGHRWVSACRFARDGAELSTQGRGQRCGAPQGSGARRLSSLRQESRGALNSHHASRAGLAVSDDATAERHSYEPHEARQCDEGDVGGCRGAQVGLVVLPGRRSSQRGDAGRRLCARRQGCPANRGRDTGVRP